MEFHIKQRTIRSNGVIQPGNRVCRGGGAVDVAPRSRGYAVSHRRSRQTAVRRRARLSAQGNIGRNRVQAGLVLAAAGVAEILQRAGIGIGHFPGKGVHFGNIVAELRHLGDHIQQFVVLRLLFRGNFVFPHC